MVAKKSYFAAPGIVETKLSRSEAVELMLEEATKQNHEAKEKLKIERSKLLFLSQEELVSLATHNTDLKPRISMYGYKRSQDDGQVEFSFNFDTDIPWFAERLQKLKTLDEQITAHDNVAYELRDKGKAKLAIMKQVLGQTPDGRRFLEQISSMSLTLGKAMLDQKIEERQKQLGR